MRLKTIRIRLKTGDLIVRKAVQEFLIGRKYIVCIDEQEHSELFDINNVLSFELYSNGEYVPVVFNKRGKI